ncbi:MAG: hypothetical protein QOE25_25, partial [Actinomycetota bacterium]|nr:hypothetical protein [Actinomycetota bacterium]
MSKVTSESVYALYPVFMSTPDYREAFADPDDLGRAAREVEDLVKRWAGRVECRGTYSTVAFRADADLMLWVHGATPDDVQAFLVEFRRTEAG